MKDKATNTDAGGDSAPRSGPPPASQHAPMATLSSTYAECMRRVEQAKGNLQQRYAEEYVNYGNAIAAAQRGVNEALQHAASRYADDVKEALAPNELAERTVQAYQRFAGLLEQCSKGEHLQREVGNAYAKFMQSLSLLDRGVDTGRAQQEYLAAVENTTAQGEFLKQAAQAHAEFLMLLKQLHMERGQRLQDAYLTYVKALNEVPKSTDFAARADAAAEAAMTALHQAWRQTSEEYDQVSGEALRAFQAMAEGSRSARSNAESH